ncbi:sugar ABC transporter permease [Microbacterium aurugineum]|uniref:carbohydrate ABC transporter permease n=1 Tax=Microbacterium TaxID=33882 RepID=UPI000CAFC498|nr:MULTISPECIES: sugar ABC transporter permease [Microbacterium]PKQ35308.1 MAG: ABC transporter permease [Actinobacteria bacterium HGW-Actinobacteria-11]MCE0509171.1 sugar ABC transporter permease [Microbacterium sp. KKR3/1]MCK8467286.1 sugar ABC transporter permease [Microbacterium aurugineum]MCZ4303065.1 sugar ABC transporter permease [Microbacterium oxydans]QEA28319.1 sugar ABC transporter permease [Microbacterium sp. CBA3102]
MVTVTETRGATSAPAPRIPADPTRRRRFGTRREGLTGWLFMTPFAVLFVLVFLVPIIVSIRSSFFAQVPAGGGLYGGGELVDTFVGLENFVTAATNGAFWTGMGRVVLYAALQIPVMILLALGLALLLDSFIVRRPTLFRLSFFLPYAVPGIIAAMMWLYLYTPEVSPFLPFLPEGTDFMAPGTILFSMANMTTWTYTGYNMLIFLSALQAVPRDLYEAARLDGASGFQISMRIKVPLVRGAALLAVLLSIIGTIQLFNEPVVLQAANSWMGKDFTPMMLTYNTMMGEISPSGSGPASAYSLLMALIAGVLAIVYALLQRRKGDA